jgi:hypothetical protein
MSLRNNRGEKITSLVMTAGTTRELYAEVDDYNNDGDLSNDYDVFPVNNPVISPIVVPDNATALQGRSTTPTLLGLTPDLPTLEIPPRTIARVNITALNPGGDQSSNYNDVYTNFVYQITFNGTTGSNVSLNSVLPNGGVIQTQRVSVLIHAYDDATGDFDDGGGTCDALGLGVAVLAMPLLFIRKKHR